MARITVEDCIDKFESRFELVLVASNRARKLHSGENPTIEKDNDKNTVIALREIADETVNIEDMKNSLVEEYQTVSPENEEELTLDYADSEEELKNKDNLEETHVNEESNEVSLSNISSENDDEKVITSEMEGYLNSSDDNNS